MRVVSVHWSVYRLPLRTSFTTAHHAMSVREGAIIELLTTRQGLSGIGEIAPLPEFGSATLDQSLAALTRLLASLRGLTLDAALDALDNRLGLEDDEELPAIAGLEMALLDALGKARERSVAELLVTKRYTNLRSHIPVNAVIGLHDPESTVAQARQSVAHGFTCLKLKMARAQPDTEIARIVAVRQAVGPAITLRLDANGGWSYEQAQSILDGCKALRLQYVEQPLPPHDIQAMAQLCRATPIPIAADEAVRTLGDAALIISEEAATFLIVKPQLSGGLQATREIIDLAKQHGVECVVTSAIETGVGLAALLHLVAATPALLYDCGLATLDLLADDLIIEPLLVQHGKMAVPSGPGLGVHLDRKALMKYSFATGVLS